MAWAGLGETNREGTGLGGVGGAGPRLRAAWAGP